MQELTAFQRDVLVVLNDVDGLNGREIKEKLEEEGDREVHHARLYTNLNELLDDGYVDKSSLDGRTNEYSVTEKGTDELRTRLQWERDQLAP